MTHQIRLVPAVDDGRFFYKSNTGFRFQIGRLQLRWSAMRGGWTIALHLLIKRDDPNG